VKHLKKKSVWIRVTNSTCSNLILCLQILCSCKWMQFATRNWEFLYVWGGIQTYPNSPSCSLLSSFLGSFKVLEGCLEDFLTKKKPEVNFCVLFYNTLSVSHPYHHRYYEQWVMNWKGHEWKWPWPNWTTCLAFAWMDGGKLSRLHLRLLMLQLRFEPYAFWRKEQNITATQAC